MSLRAGGHLIVHEGGRSLLPDWTEVQRAFFDFDRMLIGFAEKIANGEIPETLTHTFSLNENEFCDFDYFVDSKSNYDPIKLGTVGHYAGTKDILVVTTFEKLPRLYDVKSKRCVTVNIFHKNNAPEDLCGQFAYGFASQDLVGLNLHFGDDNERILNKFIEKYREDPIILEKIRRVMSITKRLLANVQIDGDREVPMSLLRRKSLQLSLYNLCITVGSAAKAVVDNMWDEYLSS